MEDNGEMLKRLARLADEQAAMSRNHDEMLRGHEAMMRRLDDDAQTARREARDLNKTLVAMLSGQAQELRELKVMSKRQERFAEDHERTLRLHYRLIRDNRDRDR